MRTSSLVLALFFTLIPGLARSAEPVGFPRATIDLGTVVTNLDASVRFYVDGIGFREVKGFDVPAGLAADAGLTDGKPLAVRVLVLGDGEHATKLKLMRIEGTAPRTGDTDFIHSHAGFRYLTIVVEDTDTALDRLAKIGVRPIAKTPVPLPDSLGPGLHLTCVRDPDGNLVELVGPRRSR